MTKKILPLLFLFLSSTLFSQTLIPDANFEQFLVDQGIDTNGITGDILNADAQAVTALNVTRNDIADFTGIEAFTNIETLNLGSNDFGTIQLNTLSLLRDFRITNTNNLSSLDFTQNPELENIYIRTNSNEPLVTLSELDLSQNLKLVSFQVLIMESLSSVIFPVTDTIEEIRLSVVAIPVIDLSQISGEFLFRIVTSRVDVNIIYPNDNMALKSLELSSIDFPFVDVSSQIGLESFVLSSTYTENFILPTTNTLTNIRISGHELNVPISFASTLELTNLSISNNFGTVPLEIDISQNLELTNLALSRNLMNDVDITNNTKLRTVDLNTNEFTSVDFSQNLELTNLNVGSNQLPDLDVSLNTELTTLNASNNLLPSIDLTQNTLLRYLYLGFNQLPTLDITQNTALWILAINNNFFTGSGLDLSQNIELFIMNISNNQVETLDFSNTVMRNLDISHNIFPGNQVLNDFYTKIASRGNLSDVVLRANNNLLTGTVPDFYSIYTDNDPTTIQHRRWWLHIENNYFHFGDFENEHLGYVSLLTTQSIGPSPGVVMQEYTYAPQEKVNTIENPSRNAGETITLLTDVRGEQNHYKWFKDGVEITDAPDSPELVLTDLDTCDEGVYYAEITSDLVPFENANAPGTNGKNLLLVRNDITLSVNATKNCVTLVNPVDGATNVPINTGIEWNDNPGACGYKITVINVDTGTPIQYNGNPITGLDVGDITLFNFDSDLPPDTEISVQITPYFDDGDFGGCTTESFTTNASAIATECTTLIDYPRNNNNDVPSDVASISWNPANAADGYKLTITSTSGINNLSETNVGNTLTYSFGQAFQAGDIVEISIVPTNSTFGDANSCSTESFTIASETVTPTPPNCTTLLNPSNTDTYVAVDLAQISWNAVANATQYRISINGSTSDLNDVTDLMVTGTSHPFTNNFDNGETVTVTIVPLNGTVEPTTPCTTQSFTIVSASPTPPNCTSLLNPSDTDTDVAVDLAEISWNAVANATQYRISINGSTSDLNDVTDLMVTGTSHPFTNDFDNGETVTVTIVPLNGTMEPTTTCSAETFTIETAAPTITPACTSLTSPIGADVSIGTTQMTWDAVTDATGYRITIAGTANNNVTDIEITGTSYDFNGPFVNGETATVTIIPFNGTENATGCTPETFTIETAAPTTTPACTSLTSPIGTDVAIGTTQMTWDAVTDATGYRITIAGTANNNVTDIEITGTSYDFNGPFVNGETATVTIIPFNGPENATGCTPETFTIETAAPTITPACTSLTSPIGADVSIGTIQMTWDAVTDATGYRITIVGTANNNVTDIEITGTSYDFNGPFVNGETATVTIIPFNGPENATGCTPETFTIESVPDISMVPECTSLTTPNNGDISVELSTSISWEESANAEGYRLTIGTTSGGNDVVDNEDVSILTSYTFMEDLMPATTYFVSITPYNAIGDAVDCEEYTFTTIAEDQTLYGFSPNGDGINDFWNIDGIEASPDNTVFIYNRWGDLVFQIQGYDNQSNVFSGTANNKTQMGASELPSGTYFFNIQVSGEHNLNKLQGFLVLKR